MSSRTKKIMALASAVLLVLLYFTIFGFSQQDGDTSSGVSSSLTRYGVKIWEMLTGQSFTEDEFTELAAFWEHPLRKLAHFSEYALLGVLVYNILYSFIVRFRYQFGVAVLWVFVSAALDEFHQYFIPGRWSSFADVCLDTSGGVVGILCCAGILWKITHRKHKKSIQT